MEQPASYWGYRETYGIVNDVSDHTVRKFVIAHLARQRGGTISLKRIVTMLRKNGIKPNHRALKVLLCELGLVEVGQSSVTNIIYRIPS